MIGKKAFLPKIRIDGFRGSAGLLEKWNRDVPHERLIADQEIFPGQAAADVSQTQLHYG